MQELPKFGIIDRMETTPILTKDLNPNQSEAVLSTEGAFMVIAGAGSGKTRVLTRRIAHLILDLGVPKNNVLAITFTNKAANEMKGRLYHLLGENTREMWISTFHAMCARILRAHGSRIDLDPHFQIIDDDDVTQLIKVIMKENNISKDMVKPRLIKNLLMNVKSGQKSLNDVEEPIHSVLSTVYHSYQNKLKRNALVDFEDLIIKVIELLKKDQETRDFYHRLFNYVLVDEFQDTNNRQYELIKWLTGPHQNLFIVGDEDQSIYAFRGANIQNIKSFEKDYQPQKIILNQNYRSTNTILNAANQVIKMNQSRIKKELFSTRDEGPKITFYKGHTNPDEIQYVTQKIIELNQKGIAFDDMAILYRANATSLGYEKSLTSNQIPYRIIGSLSFFKRKEIKDMMAYFRLLVNPHDELSFERVINEPKRGIGAKSLETLKSQAKLYDISYFDACNEDFGITGKAKNALKDFHHLILKLRTEFEAKPFLDFLETMLNMTGYSAMLLTDTMGDVRKENILELASYYEELRGMYQDYSKFDLLLAMLEDFTLRSEEEPSNQKTGVSLMTLHGAKGLEFDVVFIVSLEQGLFPSFAAKETQKELEEERRLMYVGITRAKTHLYLTNVADRLIYGQYQHHLDSEFIDAIDPELIQLEGLNIQRARNDERLQRDYQQTHSFKARKQRVLNTNINEINQGDKVTHSSFGDGVVVSVDGTQCTIAFSHKVGIKTLMKDHPAIQKVS